MRPALSRKTQWIVFASALFAGIFILQHYLNLFSPIVISKKKCLSIKIPAFSGKCVDSYFFNEGVLNVRMPDIAGTAKLTTDFELINDSELTVPIDLNDLNQLICNEELCQKNLSTPSILVKTSSNQTRSDPLLFGYLFPNENLRRAPSNDWLILRVWVKGLENNFNLKNLSIRFGEHETVRPVDRDKKNAWTTFAEPFSSKNQNNDLIFVNKILQFVDDGTGKDELGREVTESRSIWHGKGGWPRMEDRIMRLRVLEDQVPLRYFGSDVFALDANTHRIEFLIKVDRKFLSTKNAIIVSSASSAAMEIAKMDLYFPESIHPKFPILPLNEGLYSLKRFMELSCHCNLGNPVLSQLLKTKA